MTKRRKTKPPSLPVRLLGIDPGTRAAGWGIVEVKGTALQLVDCGVLRPSPKLPRHHRLTHIFEGFEQVIGLYRPVAGAVEETFAGRNPKSAIAMGEGRGVALLALARAGLQIHEFSPAEVKKAVTGNGGATKELVARMVCARLGLSDPPKPADVTDAIAVAITLVHRWPGS